MNKKTLSMVFFAFVVLVVIVCIPGNYTYASELESEYDVTTNEDLIWFEDGETFFIPNEETGYTTNDQGLRANYTSYQFSKKTNIKTIYNGNEITLFTHTINGTVYFYTDGKVHIYSLGGSVSNIHSNYNAFVKSNSIGNTDGTVSVGISEVETSSSVYPAPTFYVSVTFNFGSTQAVYSVSEG